MELLEGFETIGSFPAAYCRALDAVVVSDTHVGIEVVESRAGALMPRFQLEELLEEFERMQAETGAARLVIVGDIKHSFSGQSREEREEVERFIDRCAVLFDRVDLIQGNHDSGLEYRAEDHTNVQVHASLLAEGILFVHGHRGLSEYEGLAPETAETVVIGHEHPAVALQDAVGVTEKVACFLYGIGEDGRRILVLPAFSHLASGSEVNELPVAELLSPVLKESFEVDRLHVTAVDREAGLFDFTELGELRSL